MCFTASFIEALVCAPECLEAGNKRQHNKIDASKLSGRLCNIRAGTSTNCGLCGYPAPNRNNCGLAVANTINWCARAKPLSPGPRPLPGVDDAENGATLRTAQEILTPALGLSSHLPSSAHALTILEIEIQMSYRQFENLTIEGDSLPV